MECQEKTKKQLPINIQMTKYSLNDIIKMISELASKINAPGFSLPTYNFPIGDATPYIEVDNDGYMYYIISERGTEFSRKKFDDIDDFLYTIFSGETFSMACAYELKNRIEDKDCRRIIFEKQEELLGQLNETWRERGYARHQLFLKVAPFDDLAGLRATYCGELRKQGYSESEIDKLVYEKYPKN